MNWFQKLMLALVLFIAMLSYMVYRSSKAKLDLVTDKYYEEEIKYQDHINRVTQSDSLQTPLQIAKDGDEVMIHFPAGLNYKSIQGKLNFYFPADRNKDEMVSLQPDSSGTQSIQCAGKKGLYTVKVNWQYEGKAYYSEKKIFF
ncbi:MAG TPA: FixH family protein [Chitinophagaceae bacterium]|nr:FixH family protein [Chitinophagaceae bacterium]